MAYTRQIPGGFGVTETGTRTAQIPGGIGVTETFAANVTVDAPFYTPATTFYGAALSTKITAPFYSPATTFYAGTIIVDSTIDAPYYSSTTTFYGGTVTSSDLTLTPADIAAVAAAVIAAMNLNIPAVNVKKVNDVTVYGTGADNDTWGPA